MTNDGGEVCSDRIGSGDGGGEEEDDDDDDSDDNIGTLGPQKGPSLRSVGSPSRTSLLLVVWKRRRRRCRGSRVVPPVGGSAFPSFLRLYMIFIFWILGDCIVVAVPIIITIMVPVMTRRSVQADTCTRTRRTGGKETEDANHRRLFPSEHLLPLIPVQAFIAVIVLLLVVVVSLGEAFSVRVP